MQTLVPLLGRILLSVIFLLSGYGKITNFGGTIIMEIGGGLSLLLGYKALTRVFSDQSTLLLMESHQPGKVDFSIPFEIL